MIGGALADASDYLPPPKPRVFFPQTASLLIFPTGWKGLTALLLQSSYTADWQLALTSRGGGELSVLEF